MIDALRQVLGSDPRLAYALLFGSRARGDARPGSDVDVALEASRPLTALEVGDLVGRIEQACGVSADLVLLDEADPALAYRVFRDAVPIVVHDRAAYVARKHRAALDYLDFRPMEQRFVDAILRTSQGG